MLAIISCKYAFDWTVGYLEVGLFCHCI